MILLNLDLTTNIIKTIQAYYNFPEFLFTRKDSGVSETSKIVINYQNEKSENRSKIN